MLYFTSDLHFYHEKIIKHTNRPFCNAEEMNKTLIRNWNKKITPADEVYILGDFTMKGPDHAAVILRALNGKKHLIRGNHDRFTDSPQFDSSLFLSIKDYQEVICQNTLFVLFHYPIAEWNGIRKGAIALHGHQHNSEIYNTENRKKGLLLYDVGVDANHMAPVSAGEIIRFFS
jgi:calcineurin-like phosphoesterase family protein